MRPKVPNGLFRLPGARFLGGYLLEDLPRPLHRLARLAHSDVYHYLPDRDLTHVAVVIISGGGGAPLLFRARHQLAAWTSITGLSVPTAKISLSGSSVSPPGRESATIFSRELVPFFTLIILPTCPALSPDTTRAVAPFSSFTLSTISCTGTFMTTVSPHATDSLSSSRDRPSWNPNCM